jgi:tRNA threonylcarbamoyladenosine biosynthesis protein TsaE
LRLSSPTPESTAEIARLLAESVDGRGLLLLLDGPLGAGKTRFAQGLAEGLGIPPERVASPTFVLAQELPLPGGGVLVHVDCYRVANEAELEGAGLHDWLAPGAHLVVEWAARVPGAWPEDHLGVRLERSGERAGRCLEARAAGTESAALLARWEGRLRARGWKAEEPRAAMSLIVQKSGGTSVGDPARIRTVAHRVVVTV